jgi:transposase
LLTTLAEASAAFRERLILNAGVGPLSGKTVWATVIFLVAWAVLAPTMRQRDGVLRNATITFVILTALGLLGTFPIFFQAFAPE